MTDAPPRPGGDPGAPQRTAMAAERTWLAWWRTALAATAGALGVGRLAPELLGVVSWPYVVLGAGYAVMAIGLLLTGALRMRQLDEAVRSGRQVPLRFPVIAVFTGGGVLLTLLTMVLVIAQT